MKNEIYTISESKCNLIKCNRSPEYNNNIYECYSAGIFSGGWELLYFETSVAKKLIEDRMEYYNKSLNDKFFQVFDETNKRIINIGASYEGNIKDLCADKLIKLSDKDLEDMYNANIIHAKTLLYKNNTTSHNNSKYVYEIGYFEPWYKED